MPLTTRLIVPALDVNIIQYQLPGSLNTIVDVYAFVPFMVSTSWSLVLNPKKVVVLAPHMFCVVLSVPRLSQQENVNVLAEVGVTKVLLKPPDTEALNLKLLDGYVAGPGAAA